MTYSAGPSRFTTEEENLQLARQAQAEYEAQQQQQGGNNFIDSLGKAALVAGVGTLAALGGRRLLANRAARNATQQVRVEDLGNIGRKAEADVRRAAASTYPAPAPSQPPPSQPTPGGMVDRLGKMAEDVRQARSERMPGVIQTNLSEVSPERARAALNIINNRIFNPRNSTVEEGVQGFFRQSPAYGQLPEIAQQVVSEVKALPPARITGTDFLTSQLGGRGYIEQTVLDRAAEQAAGDLIDEVNAFSNKAARSELAKQGASVQSQQRKNLWSLVNEIQNETLVDEQQATRAFNVDQAINALDAAEDQQTGRVKQQLQRNEDVDLSRIELQEDMAEASRQAMINEASPSQMIGYEADAPINQVASQLPDGLPVDQAEGIAKTSAQRFLQRERDEIASQLGEQNLPVTPSRIEQELTNRLTKSAYEYGPKYSARRQGLELYAQTGDPILLNRIQRFGMAPASFETFETMPAEKRIGFENAPPFSTAYYPSEELSSTGLSSDININLPTRGQVSLAELRKPVITENTAQRAEEFYQERKGQALDWLGNLRVQLEPKRNQILKERRLIVEQTASDLQPQLQAARQSGNQELTAELEQNLNVLRNVWKNPRLGSHREDELRLLDAQIAGAQNKIAEDIAGIQKKYPTTIADWSGESARIFGELNTETGELIPESIEIRGDRPSRMLEPKGGGGRNLAEYTAGERLDEEIRRLQGGGRIRDYDPETGAVAQRWLGDNTQTGREIDAYGIRLSGEKRADPTKRPSEPQYTEQEIADEAMRMSQADPYGDVPVAPEYADVVESLGYQEPTPEARRSVLMSEAIRKAALMREQRNPRGGVVPDELTTLRRQLAQLDERPEVKATGRLRRVPGTSIPPQQLTLPGVTGYKSRQITSPADVAAQQLESYMNKLQRSRATPITSAVRIQPSLF